jgi:hypothetical protein
MLARANHNHHHFRFVFWRLQINGENWDITIWIHYYRKSSFTS